MLMRLSGIYRLKLWCCLLLVGGLPGGCEKGVFFRTDTIIAESFVLDPFDEIMIEDIFVIELKNDSVFSVIIESSEDIMENISYDIKDNKLLLNDNNSYKWMPDYPFAKLTISFPCIRVLNINKASEVFSEDTLNIDQLSIFCNAQLIDLDLAVNAGHISLRTETDNYGQYTLRGSAESADLRVFGSAQLWADGLANKNAMVRNYSIGDCHISAEKQLKVWIEKYGNVYYYGIPEEIIVESMTSRGRLIKKDE